MLEILTASLKDMAFTERMEAFTKLRLWTVILNLKYILISLKSDPCIHVSMCRRFKCLKPFKGYILTKFWTHLDKIIGAPSVQWVYSFEAWITLYFSRTVWPNSIKSSQKLNQVHMHACKYLCTVCVYVSVNMTV